MGECPPERLAEYLQHILSELRELIEKQHAVVREGYLAGLWNAAAADKTRG